ncbi:group II intron reverse transcriptase/maturase [Candidatus Formimonas warabiya]|uniref:Group II intron reverse transcriptase/maturase n=1 Tax=Formimonas warabiya TaxID=1761012 RepID=A0A3G1KS57_FORW1|nr:group II intron reverse transcriptase/maturase [Candidatus Formimonas warabiya]ATW25280.1 group II intron reverse transcriptase/maturase [Candidatus Formimonas warabiya]ATW25821.1 group II intron reverse transcriptase/maturase [Candidatus Formimonas warabiya]
MEQQSDYPILKNEWDLHNYLDELYAKARMAKERGEKPKFKGLLEIISSPITIQTAVHNIKSNRGAETPGSDDTTIRDFLEKPFGEVIHAVQEGLKNYQPIPIRRVHIPKPGKQETRPLGIPSIFDRVIQECIRLVIEPILEAQFFNHSYGFRPYRDAHMALERITNIVHQTGYHWVIEGDISKFFDTISHTKLIKQLWHLGIRDRRILMLIKQMLKTGIMNEVKVNPEGTQQGGIISPLLANAYLNTFDEYIANAWENKKTRHQYAFANGRLRALRNQGTLKPAYLVRYCDDWVIITNTKKNAERWKNHIQQKLKDQLKLKLSEEKTKLTCVKKSPISFLGFTYKVVPSGKARKGYVTKTHPHPERLKCKVAEIRKEVKKIYKQPDRELIFQQILKVNAMTRGIINYYQAATHVYLDLCKHAWGIFPIASRVIKKLGGGMVPANQVSNLQDIHQQYTKKIAAIQDGNRLIGITSLSFCKWQQIKLKNRKETPYTVEGRELYLKRTGKKTTLPRQDEILSSHLLSKIHNKGSPPYNFEYFLNRGYTFNRDKGKCRICGEYLSETNVEFHHIQTKLTLDMVNRVPNLVSVCTTCHDLIHSNCNISNLPKSKSRKLTRMREKLT